MPALDLSRYIVPDTLVHAYGIEGDKSHILPTLTTLLEEKLGIALSRNPDAQLLSYGHMGIQDARVLEDRSLRRSFSNTRKIFIITADGITREAQNALLKLFEEPVADTHFFVVIPSHEILLPTLQSRLLLISARDNVRDHARAEAFVAASAALRLELLKEITDTKDKKAALLFLDELEMYLYNKVMLEKMTSSEVVVFQDIGRAKRYLHDRAPSVKMLLEEIALVLPRYSI